MGSLSEKRKFIIAHSNSDARLTCSTFIQKQIPQASIVEARDGGELQIKLDNDFPHVVVIEELLPRGMAKVLFDRILKKYTGPEFVFAFVIIGPIPVDVNFIDEIASGQLQYVSDINDEEKFGDALSRALNFVSHKTPSEYFLRFLAKDELLLSEGTKADCVYILKKGELRAFTSASGSVVTLGIISVGEFVGEMAYINGEPRSASVSANINSELIEIPINHLDHILLKNPAWSKALMKTLSDRLKKSNKKSK